MNLHVTLTRTRVVLACGAAAALTLGALTALAQATTPGQNGPIAFTRYRAQTSPVWSEIYSVNPDGSGSRRISRDTGPVEDDQADWSPDGSTIVFQRNIPGRPFSIWSMRSDGTQVERLSPPCPVSKPIATCVNDSGPSFSPDGKSIAFERDSGPLKPVGSTFANSVGTYSEAIVVADLHFRHVRKVTWFGPYHGDNGGPVWSPDGSRLAFTEHNDNAKSIGGPTNGVAVYVVNVDGTGLRRITPWALNATVSDWAPDGQHLLLTSEPHGDAQPGGNLYTIRPDGTGLQQLTHYAATYRVLPGAYSPNGKSIVFATNAGSTGGNAVVTIDVDGSNPRPLTSGATFDGWPDWGTRP